MNDSNRFQHLILILVAAVGVVLLSLICQPSNPSTELAITAREAVKLARDSERTVTNAVIWSHRFRLLAIAIGVSVPVVVAYLIFRSASQAEPDPVEILDRLEQLGVSRLDTLPPPKSPNPLPSSEEVHQDASS